MFQSLEAMRYELSDHEWTAIEPMLPASRAAFDALMTVASYHCDARQSPASVALGVLLPRTTLLADRGYDADWTTEFACRKEHRLTFR